MAEGDEAEIDNEVFIEKNGCFYPTCLENLVMGGFKEGTKIEVDDFDFEEQRQQTVHYEVKHLREAMKEIYQVYSSGGNKKEFTKVLDKLRKKRDTDIHDFESRLENIQKNKIFKVVERKEKKNGEVIVKFKEIKHEDKSELIKKVARKLAQKVSRKDLEILFEQSILKLNDTEKLEKLDKKLNKKSPKVEGKRGCFQLMVDDIDVMIIN